MKQEKRAQQWKRCGYWGDQLNEQIASLKGREPGTFRVLFVESRAKVGGRRWHRQRVHLVLAAMRRLRR